MANTMQLFFHQKRIDFFRILLARGSHLNYQNFLVTLFLVRFGFYPKNSAVLINPEVKICTASSNYPVSIIPIEAICPHSLSKAKAECD